MTPPSLSRFGVDAPQPLVICYLPAVAPPTPLGERRGYSVTLHPYPLYRACQGAIRRLPSLTEDWRSVVCGSYLARSASMASARLWQATAQLLPSTLAVPAEARTLESACPANQSRNDIPVGPSRGKLETPLEEKTEQIGGGARAVADEFQRRAASFQDSGGTTDETPLTSRSGGGSSKSSRCRGWRSPGVSRSIATSLGVGRSSLRGPTNGAGGTCWSWPTAWP